MSVTLPASERGIYRQFIDAMGYIKEQEWHRAVQMQTAVGRCRREHCNGILHALPIDKTHDGEWYEAQCDQITGRNGRHGVAALNGAVLPKSSAHSHMPHGAWDRRLEILKKMRDLAKGEAA